MTDRRTRFLIALAAAGLAIICVLIFNYSLSLKRERSLLKTQAKELLELKNEYLKLREVLDATEGKKSLTRVSGIVEVVDGISKTLGLTQKVKSVKATGTRDKKYAIEEEAELQIDKVSMNEMTNLMFRIENAPMILPVRKTTIRTSFDSPSLLNVTMTLGLIRPK